MLRALLACVVSSLIVGLFFGVFMWIEDGFQARSLFQGTVFASFLALIIAVLVGLPCLRLARKRQITGGFYYARAGVLVGAAFLIGPLVVVRNFDMFVVKAAVLLVVSGAVTGLAFNRIANGKSEKRKTENVSVPTFK
jgi:hypothetical protein